MDAGDRSSLQSSQAGERGIGVNNLRRQQVEQPIERNGGDVPVGVDHSAVAQFQSLQTAVADLDHPDGMVEKDSDGVLFKPAEKFAAVQAVERDGRQFDFKAARMAHEAVHEDLAGVAE